MLLKNFCKVLNIAPSSYIRGGYGGLTQYNTPYLTDNRGTNIPLYTGLNYSLSSWSNSSNGWQFPTAYVSSSYNNPQTYLYPEMICNGSYNSAAQYSNYRNYFFTGILLGSGATTQPTFDDYQLEAQTTGLTHIGSPLIINLFNNGVFRILQTVRNNTANAITVNEMALAIGAAPIVNNSYVVPNYIILTREILDDPVTIQPGEDYTFTIEINLFSFSDGYNRPQAVS